MSRAKNDRNVVKFGPAAANVELEVRKLRREQFSESFRLTEGGLLLPEVGVPGVPGVPGPVGPPPVVIPSDLNTALLAGFPYNVKDAFGLPAVSGRSGVPYVFKFERVSPFSSVLTLAAQQSVSLVEFPSGATTSIPFATDTRGFLDVGNKVVVTGYSEKLGEVYDKDTGVFTDLLYPVDDLNFYKNLGYTLYDDFGQYENYLFSLRNERTGYSKPFLLDSAPGHFFIFRSAVMVGKQFSWRNIAVRVRVYWLYAYNRTTLERSDFPIYSSNKQDEAVSPPLHNPIATNNSVAWLGRTGQFAERNAIVFSETFASVVPQASNPPTLSQARRGFVDSQNRIVYMHFNDQTDLWEIHRMNPAGVKSILPLVFSGNPEDQPVYGTGSSTSFYAPFSSSINNTDLVPGVCQAPDGGYFIYGSVDIHFGEFLTREGGTVPTAPVFRSIPAIWYTNGTQTQRIWTFEGTEENPILELATFGAGVSRIPRVTFARYDGATRSLNFSVYLQNQRLLVRQGDNTLQSINSTSATANLLLYRAQL